MLKLRIQCFSDIQPDGKIRPLRFQIVGYNSDDDGSELDMFDTHVRFGNFGSFEEALESLQPKNIENTLRDNLQEWDQDWLYGLVKKFNGQYLVYDAVLTEDTDHPL